MSVTLAILGDGAWGTAMAILLAQKPEHQVTLWSARAESAAALRRDRENVRLLPGVPIPETVVLSADIADVARADLWVSAIPTAYLRATLRRVAEVVPAAPPIVSLTKGLENDTFCRPTQILEQLFQTDRLTVLSGPSHAEETSRGMPTSVVAASADLDLALWVQRLFSTDRFRVYTNLDLIGVELAGALKNVIGIAAGIGDGLGLGDNAKSALMTRGLAEMTRFGVALGAEPDTFTGLAGVGDLITTCVSPHGRNRLVGARLGNGEKLAAIVASMPKVAEGVYTARSVHDRAARMNIDMPITSEVYQVLYEGKDPWQAVNDLMLRRPRGEGERGSR